VEGCDAPLVTFADEDDAREGVGLAGERTTGHIRVARKWARMTPSSSSRAWSTAYRSVLPA
jgi:hypothetical protein